MPQLSQCKIHNNKVDIHDLNMKKEELPELQQNKPKPTEKNRDDTNIKNCIVRFMLTRIGQ